MIIVRYADDIIVGFDYEAKARRSWDEMRELDQARLIRMKRQRILLHLLSDTIYCLVLPSFLCVTCSILNPRNLKVPGFPRPCRARWSCAAA